GGRTMNMNGIVPLVMLALVAAVFMFLGSVAREMVGLRHSRSDARNERPYELALRPGPDAEAAEVDKSAPVGLEPDEDKQLVIPQVVVHSSWKEHTAK